MPRYAVQPDPLFRQPGHALRFFWDIGDEGEESSSRTVLPEQDDPSSVARGYSDGEIALRRAILHDAICCFRSQFVTMNRRSQRVAKEAEQWLFSDDICWPFSFVNICAVLGVNPACLQRRLKRWSWTTPFPQNWPQRNPVRRPTVVRG